MKIQYLKVILLLTVLCLGTVDSFSQISQGKPEKKSQIETTKGTTTTKQQSMTPQTTKPQSSQEKMLTISRSDLSSSSGTINGHGYVDLGLSVKWATCNVGASSPTDYGNYYAWGETGAKSENTKENSIRLGTNIGNISGNSNYDAATVNWGNIWRMPTFEDMEELAEKCIFTWVTCDGHNGYKVTGPNGNSIFLPAAGNSHGSIGEFCFYWSATPYESNLGEGAFCSFCNKDQFIVGWMLLSAEYSIRPVSNYMESTSKKTTESVPNGTINGHEYVDLGLSVKWATCNVGASSPTDYGNYYAWGETRTKSTYTEDNCVTYNKSMGDIAGNANYDAARANWGGTWRLPTKDEIQELIEECEWIWTTGLCCNCYKVIGPNGNSILFPAAGRIEGDSLLWAGCIGQYWSAMSFESDIYAFGFNSGDFGIHSASRQNGRTVRPVSE